MKVHIRKKETGQVIASYPVVVGIQDNDPTRRAYETEAWRCAVADGVVEDQDLDKYEFGLDEKEEKP